MRRRIGSTLRLWLRRQLQPARAEARSTNVVARRAQTLEASGQRGLLRVLRREDGVDGGGHPAERDRAVLREHGERHECSRCRPQRRQRVQRRPTAASAVRTQQHRLLDRWRHEQGAGAVRFGAVPRLSAKPLPPRSFNSLPLSGSRNQNQTLIITNR